MADIVSQPTLANTDIESRAALLVYISETQKLLDQMQLHQLEINQFKLRAAQRDQELLTLKSATVEILNRLEQTSISHA